MRSLLPFKYLIFDVVQRIIPSKSDPSSNSQPDGSDKNEAQH